MRTFLPRFAFLASLLGLVAALPGSVAAQPEAAQAALEAHHRRVNALLARPANEARNRELDVVLDQLLDYDELAKRSLGNQYAQRTPAERQQFATLLHDIVQKSYRDNLQRTLRFDLRYLAAETRGNSVIVRTEARSRTNRRQPPVGIDYSMHLVNGTWRVFDVTTDGVSMVQNYRTQFNRIIAREGWSGLIQRMQARLNGEDAPI